MILKKKISITLTSQQEVTLLNAVDKDIKQWEQYIKGLPTAPANLKSLWNQYIDGLKDVKLQLEQEGELKEYDNTTTCK
jgi:hypothetical protein